MSISLFTMVAGASWAASILTFVVALYIAVVLTLLVRAVRDFQEQEAQWEPPTHEWVESNEKQEVDDITNAPIYTVNTNIDLETVQNEAEEFVTQPGGITVLRNSEAEEVREKVLHDQAMCSLDEFGNIVEYE